MVGRLASLRRNAWRDGTRRNLETRSEGKRNQCRASPKPNGWGEEWWLQKFGTGRSNVDGKFKVGRRRFSREWPVRWCFNWEARRAIGERDTERGRDFVGGGRFNFPAGVGRRVGRERNGGGVGKAKRQNGIVGCREGTGGRRALAGMIVGRERGIGGAWRKGE